MSAPTSTWRFICSNSAAVRLPGLLRMCSGTASLPVSCSSAAASMALSVGSSVTPAPARAPIAYALHASDVTVRHVVFRVDRHGERFDRGHVQTIHLLRRAGWRPRAGRTTRATSGGSTTRIGRIDGHGAQADCWIDDDRGRGQRRRGKIAERQPQEVLRQIAKGDCFASSPTAIADEAGVQHEVDGRRGRTAAAMQRRQSAVAAPTSGGTPRELEERVAADPERQRRRGGVERDPRPSMLLRATRG